MIAPASGDDRLPVAPSLPLSVQRTGQAQAGELLQLWGGALHPRDAATAVTAGGHNIQLWDLRTMAMWVRWQPP